ncbi:Vp8 [Banna virus]|uniref:Vp8 n=1 Tax=Banna virus TaxID=77763 RepID=Q9YWP0_BANNV|nr:Vp8 [Banna virus]
MANRATSAFLDNPHPVGVNYVDEGSRQFVAVAELLASKLIASSRESDESNSDVPFVQAYSKFADDNPRHLRVKTGGKMANALTNVIRSYYSINAPAIVPQVEIDRLASKATVSGDMYNSYAVFNSVPIVEVLSPAQTTVSIVGSDRADVTMLNTGAGAANITFNFGQIAETVILKGSVPFQLARANQPMPAARFTYKLRPLDGPFIVVLPIGNPLVINATATTRIQVSPAFNKALVESGFQTAMNDGLFDAQNVNYYSSFDEFIIPQYHALDGINRVSTCVVLGLALQAYDQMRRALPVRRV